MTSSPVIPTTARPEPWLLIWIQGEEEVVHWESSPDLPHWQLVGLLEAARRAVEGW